MLLMTKFEGLVVQLLGPKRYLLGLFFYQIPLISPSKKNASTF